MDVPSPVVTIMADARSSSVRSASQLGQMTKIRQELHQNLTMTMLILPLATVWQILNIRLVQLPETEMMLIALLQFGQLHSWAKWQKSAKNYIQNLGKMNIDTFVCNSLTHGLRTPSFFPKIRNFWDWADKLGWNCFRHLGYFQSISTILALWVPCPWVLFPTKNFGF